MVRTDPLPGPQSIPRRKIWKRGNCRMTRRLNNWLENHYVVVVSSLISSIIVCLAVLAGLEARRTPHPQAWAMRPAEAGKVPAEAPPRAAPAPQPQEPPGAPRGTPPGGAALEEPDEPGSRELPPQAPASPAAGSEDPPPMRRKLHDKPRPVTKPAPAPVEAEPAPPLTRETEKRAIRTLRPRQAPAIRRGRILRPR